MVTAVAVYRNPRKTITLIQTERLGDELVALMDKLGFAKFDLVGHDRGGRVSYRLTLDHPERVQRLAVFDVIPISEAWGLADTKFAMTYWPWSLLSQKAPLPEKYLLGAPDAVFGNPFGAGSFSPEVKAEYLETYRDPTRVHGICEEYRAAAGLDIEHDKKDQKESRRIACPMLHLLYGPPADHSTPSTDGRAARWESGGSGPTTCKGKPLRGALIF